MQVFECAFLGYRALRSIRFALRRPNVLVGDNGVRKANLYRALELLLAAGARPMTVVKKKGATWIRGLTLGGDVAE
jgi:hypothetical protein